MFTWLSVEVEVEVDLGLKPDFRPLGGPLQVYWCTHNHI